MSVSLIKNLLISHFLDKFLSYSEARDSVLHRTAMASILFEVSHKYQSIIVVTPAPESFFFMLFYVTILSCIKVL